METLFVFDKRNYLDCQNAFRGPRNTEYYLGDYTIESASVIDVRAERKAVGACSLIRLRSKTRLFFRRSWSHIREDATDVAVLWFVKRGRLCVTHQCGETIAEAGDFVVTKSMSPFTIECLPGDDAQHEVFHVLVPTHMLRRLVAHDVKPGFCVPARGRRFAIAERIFSDIFEDPGELKESVATILLDSALSVLSDAISQHETSMMRRQSLSDMRLQEVLRYIENHLSDPKLSVAMVAEGCGISQRYLSLLLKYSGTTFSTLVWNKRLQTAGQWLSSSKPVDASVSEIAFRVGFKSSAHFSRMFKREFKMSPTEYRNNPQAQPTRPREPQAFVVEGGDARH